MLQVYQYEDSWLIRQDSTKLVNSGWQYGASTGQLICVSARGLSVWAAVQCKRQVKVSIGELAQSLSVHAVAVRC